MTPKMPWFRMYTDFLSDPKMIALAFEDQRHFIAILALKSEGVLEQDCDETMLNRIVAQRLWADFAIITEVKKRLIAAGLIYPDWQPVAWGKRQFRSDKDVTGAERQRRFRESQKGNALRNGAVTLPEADTDTDKEEEKNKETKKPAPATRIASVSAAELQELDVDSQVASEFLAIRKKKRAALTPLALAGIRREADAAGWTLDQALRKCVERGWQSFEADWVADRQQSSQRQPTNADRNADWDARMNEVLAESLRPARQPMKDMGKIDAIN